jgi:hypothetical protein
MFVEEDKNNKIRSGRFLYILLGLFLLIIHINWMENQSGGTWDPMRAVETKAVALPPLLSSAKDLDLPALPIELLVDRSGVENRTVLHYEHGFKGPYQVPYSYMLDEYPAFCKSPFRLRWKRRYGLPEWAMKKNCAKQKDIPEGKHVCLVHVGKTAGSTVGCSLGFSLHCHNDAPVPKGVLPFYTTNLMHNDVNDCVDNSPYYLFVVRNPLERIKSAYLYDRSVIEDALAEEPFEYDIDDYGQYLLYMDCPFWTLNEFAENGLGKNANASQVCKDRAYKAIRGQERHGYHLFFNYRYFLEDSGATADQVLVIRTEHAEDDWNSVEAFLSGDKYVKPVDRQFPKNNDSGRLGIPESDRSLSDYARELLCQALCDEIQVYKSIIYHAQNLDIYDFLRSMDELYESCPVQARTLTCPPASVGLPRQST